jgi:hypothetical protein
MNFPVFGNNLTDYPYVFPLNIDSDNITATVRASFGYQGMADFRVSLDGSFTAVYGLDCDTCAAAPNYATNYFDTSIYPS